MFLKQTFAHQQGQEGRHGEVVKIIGSEAEESVRPRQATCFCCHPPPRAVFNLFALLCLCAVLSCGCLACNARARIHRARARIHRSTIAANQA